MNASRLIFPPTARAMMRAIRAPRVFSGWHARCPVRSLTLSVPARPDQARVVRNRVKAVLGPEHLAIDTALLVISELLNNAIQHGSLEGQEVSVRVRTLPRSRVLVVVADQGAGRGAHLRLRPPTPDAPNGRGLFIVAELAARWSVRRSGTGHRVRALLGPEKANEREKPSALTPLPLTEEASGAQAAFREASGGLRECADSKRN